jgi:hypothetical protein
VLRNNPSCDRQTDGQNCVSHVIAHCPSQPKFFLSKFELGPSDLHHNTGVKVGYHFATMAKSVISAAIDNYGQLMVGDMLHIILLPRQLTKTKRCRLQCALAHFIYFETQCSLLTFYEECMFKCNMAFAINPIGRQRKVIPKLCNGDAADGLVTTFIHNE